MESVHDWAELGERVRQARLASSLSQAELAQRVDLERTALVRVEAGQRHVSALELMRLSEVLKLPLAHFVTRSPAAVTSRRLALAEDADAASRSRFLLDADLETHTRDTEMLIGHDLLHPPPLGLRPKVPDRESARELASRIRASARIGSEPIESMPSLAESFGLYLTVCDRDVEGASLIHDGFGVAVIGGHAPPGRRRFTAAHELGHHLQQDVYHSDAGVASSRDDREALIDAFAAELLLPEAAIRAAWPAQSPRQALVLLAGRYRVSWSVVVDSCLRLGLITQPESQRLRAETPVRGDFLAVLGYEPVQDLVVGETGPAWRRAVLAAWQQAIITADRAVELLRGAITPDDLPSRETMPGQR